MSASRLTPILDPGSGNPGEISEKDLHSRSRVLASFAIGVGGTGWTLQGEVFPTAVRGQAAAIAATVDWLANFVLIEVFPVWQNAISLGGVLVCFAALCVAAIAFVYWFLPETRGLPVEEIVTLFEKTRQKAK